MRINSSKQSQASRKNGGKSNGPKSTAGKTKSAQNSIQDGIFSRKVVVKGLGEEQSEYDEVKKTFRRDLRPSNALEEMLVTDFTENWWRRERIRRAEQVELENRLVWFEMRSDLRRSADVRTLESRFGILVGLYLASLQARSSEGRDEITGELEKVRGQLTSTTLGIDFLLGHVKDLVDVAATNGVLSDTEELLLKACFGFVSRETARCLKVNLISKRESKKWEKSDSEQSGTPKGERKPPNNEAERQTEEPPNNQAEWRDEPPSRADCSAMLAMGIETAADDLRLRRATLKFIEEAEARRARSLATVDPTSADRFSRAETAMERRMYRALAALSALKAQDIPPLLPAPGSKKPK